MATPFKIHVPDEVLALTKQKLLLSRLPDQLQNVTWEGLAAIITLLTVDGTPVSEIERLRDHWLNNYDWRTHESKINELPQFTIPIDMDDYGEMTIHFVHQLSTHKNAIPLIFIHGWPGSFYEIHKILPLLTNPKDGEQAFHVVSPRSSPSHLLQKFCSYVDGSLPGYCWSTNPSKKGFNLAKIAETFNKLMQKLGYTKYVAQGGDWGSLIARRLGQLFPKNCKAVHVNLLFTTGPPRITQGPLIWLKWVTLIGPIFFYDKREIEALKSFKKFMDEETGYQVLNSRCLRYGWWLI